MRWVGVVLVLVVASTAVGGQTARDILDQRRKLDETTQRWGNREEHIRVDLHRKGKDPETIVVYQRRTVSGDRDSVLFFTQPAGVRGMGFLTLSREAAEAAAKANEAEDEKTDNASVTDAKAAKKPPPNQWVYLPALRRIRGIDPTSRSDAFLGELSYEDLEILQSMSQWTEAEAPSTLRAAESVEGTRCHVIELTPKLDNVSYDRIVIWLGADDLVPRRMELFEDDAKVPVKRLVQRDIRPVQSIPVAHAVEVENVESGGRTSFSSTDVRFNQDLEPRLFSAHGLERGAP